MYKLILFLIVLIVALQYRLWLGDGSIREYRELQARIEEMNQEGERRQARNAALAADVKDLKEGTEAVEERARQELGMIKPGETFVQVYEASKPQPVDPSPEGTEAKSSSKKHRTLKAKPEITTPERP